MIRKLPDGRYRLYLAQAGSEDRPSPKSRDVQEPRGGREARAGGAILQARLSAPRARERLVDLTETAGSHGCPWHLQDCSRSRRSSPLASTPRPRTTSCCTEAGSSIPSPASTRCATSASPAEASPPSLRRRSTAASTSTSRAWSSRQGSSTSTRTARRRRPMASRRWTA